MALVLIRSIFAPALLLFLVLPEMFGQQGSDNSFALTGVAIVNVRTGVLIPRVTVVIRNGRIAGIGRSLRIPGSLRLVDARGKFLVPGFWDSHVHLWGKADANYTFPLLIANGVTSIRNMGSPWELIEAVLAGRQEISAGKRQEPRIVTSGPLVDGHKPARPGPITVSVSGPAEARSVVQEHKERGTDFVKTYDFLSREEYYAIASECKNLRIPFGGHVPISVSALEASDAGQASIEHLRGIDLHCSTNERELREELMDALSKSASGGLELRNALFKKQDPLYRSTWDERKAARLFLRFRVNGTWQCPTLRVIGTNDVYTDANLRYVPAVLRNSWESATKYDRTDSLRWRQEIFAAMNKAGVHTILAGTDASNPYVIFGFSLHDEMGLLQQAGLSNLQSLQAATLNPAIFLHLDKELGAVEQGKIADLVLLDANPLEDISNTRKISAVILNGRLFLRPELDKMLKGVETIVNGR
jgi:imidazolonepropionase-like amidohydrolase